MGVLAVVLLGTLGACGSGGANTAAPAANPVAVVPMPSVMDVKPGAWVVMGSSTAAGAGASAGKGWVALLGAAYGTRGAQIANIAKGGTVTYEGLSTSAGRVAGRPGPDPAINIDQALSRRPALLIVSYPTNDTAAGYSVDETVHNLLSIRAQALAAGVPVVITSTQPRNLENWKLTQLRTINQRLLESVGACFVDVRQALASDDDRLSPRYDSGDGIHPNELGHQLIADAIQKTVNGGQCIRLQSS